MFAVFWAGVRGRVLVGRTKANHRQRVEQVSQKRRRTPIPHDLQVRVMFRDGWMCHWCGRPVIFGPALRLLQESVQKGGWRQPLAYSTILAR
jgi:hypothetical protein